MTNKDIQREPKKKTPAEGNKQGVTLLLVMVVLSAVLTISVGIANIIFGQIRISGESSDSFRAFLATDRAIERKLYEVLVHQNICQGPGIPSSPTLCNNHNNLGGFGSGQGCANVRTLREPDNNGDGFADIRITARGRFPCSSTPRVIRAFEIAF